MIVESFEHPAAIFEHLVAGLQITNTDLLPNYALRHAIGRWADGHNIKLPDPVSVPIQAEKKVTPTQRLLEWGQCLPNPTAPVTMAVNRLYRGNSQEQVHRLLRNKTRRYSFQIRCVQFYHMHHILFYHFGCR